MIKHHLISLMLPLFILFPFKANAIIETHKTTNIPQNAIAQTAKTYRVKLGDTVSGIAVKFGLTLTQLLNYNPSLKSNPNLLQVGQNINLTSTGASSTQPSKPRTQASAFSEINIPIEVEPLEIRDKVEPCNENNLVTRIIL